MNNQDKKLTFKNYDKFITPLKTSPNKAGLIFPIQLDNIKSFNQNTPSDNPFSFGQNNITPFSSTPKRANMLNLTKTQANDFYSINEEGKINFETFTPIKNSNTYHNTLSKSNNLNQSPINNKQVFDLLFYRTDCKTNLNFNDSMNNISKNLQFGNLFDDLNDKNLNLRLNLDLEKEKINPKPCNCKKSKCLKLYCDCFISGYLCTKECQCCDCFNNQDNIEIVNKIRNEMKANNPKSFENKTKWINNFKIHSRGCNCKKSNCQKNYCECFINNIACTNLCNCCDCKNISVKDKDIVKNIKIDQNINKRNKFHLDNLIKNNISKGKNKQL